MSRPRLYWTWILKNYWKGGLILDGQLDNVLISGSYPEPDFSSSATAARTTAQAMTDTSYTGDSSMTSNRGFTTNASPMPTNTASLGSLKEIPANSRPMPSVLVEEDPDLISELCQLQIGFAQHKLYARMREMLSTDTTILLQSAPGAQGETMSIAGLELGKSLEHASRLRALVNRTDILQRRERCARRRQDKISPAGGQILQEKATFLLVLSCYSRLEAILASTLDCLYQARERPWLYHDLDQLMPTLVVDGFSVITGQEMQLSFAIHLCQQTLGAIQQCTDLCGPFSANKDFQEMLGLHSGTIRTANMT